MPSLTLQNREDARSMAALLSVLLLASPAGVLGAAALSRRAAVPLALWIGIGVTLLLALVILRHVIARPMRSPLTGLPSAIGAVSLWVAQFGDRDPLGHFGLGLLVMLASGLFAGYALFATGAPALRQARLHAGQLARRREWPTDLSGCRQLPEVKALHDAVRDEAAPALSLLADPRPPVRLAALAALEFRRNWRAGQPDLVLNTARTDPHPEVRAAAVLALGGIHQRLLIEEMTHCLRDPSILVRRATVDSLLADGGSRWNWVRHAIHEALGDARFLRDGPLTLSNGSFNDQAVSDLAAWATESGALGMRATQTLALHYSQRLSENPDPKLLAQLRDHVASSRASANLRIELAHLLRKHCEFSPDLLDRLVDPANPSPLRLLAVEEMLLAGEGEKAIEVLRQIARQPNRELALHAAVVVQKYLQIDLGLELGEPAPALHTKQAAEVTRRVIEWASTRPPVDSPSRSSQPVRRSSHDSRLAAPAAPLAEPSSSSSDVRPDKFAPLEWD